MHISNGKIVTEQPRETSSASKWIIVGIVICLIIILVLVTLIMYMQSSVLKVYVDGVSKSVPEELFIINQETGEISVSLQDLAETLGYRYNNGEYNVLSEDTDKCYIQTSNETASFFLNSNIIYKSPINKDRNTYEYYDLGEVVRKDDQTGKLYTNEKGAELSCNISIDYDINKNTIQIFTLPYLVQYYNTAVTEWGYVSAIEEDDLENQKAILYGLLLVKKDEESEKIGIISTENKEIVGLKYDKLIFNENTENFFAYDGDKVGIVSSKGSTIIQIKYEDIAVLDKDLKLYVVTSNKKKGVVNENGRYIIYAEYDEIGINPSEFENDNITNQYLLMGEVIPAKQNQKWGLFDKKGNNIVPFEYDEIGCSNKSNIVSEQSANSLLIIPNYKAIVLGKENKYGIYNTKGDELVQCALDAAYSISSGGVNTYYMIYNNQIMNIAEYLNQFMPNTSNQQTTQNTENNEQQSNEEQNSQNNQQEQTNQGSENAEEQNGDTQSNEQQGQQEQNQEGQNNGEEQQMQN